ncbi:MAG: hypothetical protein RI947_1402 [Candidatus Parcubacteria bacterium]|jgi:hypothetical protein
MSTQPPESIVISVHKVEHRVTLELLLRRLFNRGIEIASSQNTRRNISAVTHGLIEVTNVLLSHYREAQLTKLRGSLPPGDELNRQVRFFLDSTAGFLPTEWSSVTDKAINKLTMLFFEYLNRTVHNEQDEIEAWHSGWFTEVIPQIVALGAEFGTTSLDDPFHPDFGHADALFSQEMQRIGLASGGSLARKPTRHPETPDTIIQYTLMNPRGYFIVDLDQDTVTLDKEASWELGTWALWPIYSPRKESAAA